MKMLDIARKDLLRAFRSASFLVMGFAIPILVSALFYFAFGGLASDDGGFNVPATTVRIVNLDAPVATAAGFSAGQLLVDFFQSEGLASLVQVSESPDAASARTAVDRQQANVAVIIPDGLTRALVGTHEDEPPGTEIEVYSDPTLTLGPSIVSSLVRQFVDGLAGSQIATQVASEQLAAAGAQASQAALIRIATAYGQWAASSGTGMESGESSYLAVRSPSASGESTDVRSQIVSMIMAGMLVFYIFFTGASTAQSLLQEEESGTLPRLRTTPISLAGILGGRSLATLVTLVVQMVVLLVLSALIFRIDWGPPLLAALVSLALILLSAGFGLFVTSLLRDTRQAGFVYGGVLTLAGMIGMIGIFTTNVPGAARGAFAIVPLFVPHGWAVMAWQRLLEGGGLVDILLPMAVMLAMAGVFFMMGLIRFRRRFS